MSIAKYIKELGRGKEGARSIDRAQAADLLGQILDGRVSDLEIGAFCIAMRIKGETPQEMAGFLDAVHARTQCVQSPLPLVIIPSYNGARKLPGLTTLLAALLAREGAARGFGVVVHGCTSEAARVPTREVFALVFKKNQQQNLVESSSNAVDLNLTDRQIQAAIPFFVPTQACCRPLFDLLRVREKVGLRNPAHSLVKLMNLTNRADALIVTSYTHPEYLRSMTDTLQLTGSHALLLRGTEGESVADPRRRPRMDGFIHGQPVALCEQQDGSLTSLPGLPKSCDAATTAAYTQQVLCGELPVPAPIAAQVEHILLLMDRLTTTKSTTTT